MTTMNLYIRKHTFSQKFGYEYFFNFFKIFEHDDISADLSNKLINFIEMSNLFRTQAIERIHPMQGNTLKFYTDPNVNYGFTMIGFIDHEVYKNIFLNLSYRADHIESALALYQELGWSLSPTRKAIVDAGDYNLETDKYRNINFTFDEIKNMYDSVEDLIDD